MQTLGIYKLAETKIRDVMHFNSKHVSHLKIFIIPFSFLSFFDTLF